MRNITIITGASSGIGKEFFRQLYNSYSSKKESSEIWLIARNEGQLRQAEKEITSNAGTPQNPAQTSVRTRIFPMDISGTDGVKRFQSLIETECKDSGKEISLLINNAGFGTYGTFESTDLSRQMQMIELNCTTLTGICGLCIPRMKKGGLIINVSSLAAFLPLGNFAVYAATKAYVLSFSTAIAAELKDKGIKVCALCPGSVSTNFANIASNGARKEVLHGRDPEKIVRHCLKKAGKGKPIILYGIKWKLTAFISHFVSRYTGARYTFLYNKRPSNPYESNQPEKRQE